MGILDPLLSSQWHIVNTQMPENELNVTSLWDQGVTGTGVHVAIIDDGLDSTSLDLKDNFVRRRRDGDSIVWEHPTHASSLLLSSDRSSPKVPMTLTIILLFLNPDSPMILTALDVPVRSQQSRTMFVV